MLLQVTLNQRRLGVRIGALTAFLLLGLLVGKFLLVKPSAVVKWNDGRVIPPEGLVFNPRARIPFDPGEVVKDFTRIYAAMDGFRKIHRRLPTPAELLDFSKEIVPGVRLGLADFQTPDAVNANFYADTSPGRKDYGIAFPNHRPDGAPRPAFPGAGERDVWLASSACARRDQHIFQDGHSETTYFGFHLVLWSDGVIERVPQQSTVWFNSHDGGLQMEFPGQAGLPSRIWTAKEVHLMGGSFNKTTYE